MATSGAECSFEMHSLGPYHDDIKSQKLRRPGLEILDSFMDSERKAFIHPALQPERAFDVNIIHILDSGEVREQGKCDTRRSFDVAMEAAPGRISTLILVEDLSPAAIETLGNAFDLAPEFFALHLQGTQCFNTGEWLPPKYPELELLPSYCKKAPFYPLQICRPYQFPGGLKEVKNLRKTKTNTPRGVYRVDRLENAAMQERASVYTTTDKNNKNTHIGIIVTDRLLKCQKLLAFKTDPVTAFDFDSDDQPSHSKDRHEYSKEQMSSRDVVRRWLLRLSVEDRITLFDRGEMLAIRPLISLISTASSMFWFDARLYSIVSPTNNTIMRFRMILISV